MLPPCACNAFQLAHAQAPACRHSAPPRGAAPALTAPAARAAQPMAVGTCVIVGDDEALLREAEALAVERLGCALFRGREAYEMSSHMQHTFNRLPYDQRCAASLHLLTDMELLAHTDFFVGAAPPAICGCGHRRTAALHAWRCAWGAVHARTDVAACARGMSAAGRALGCRRSRLGTRRHGGRRAHLASCCARRCSPAQRGGRGARLARRRAAAEQGGARRLVHVGPVAAGGEDAVHAVRQAPPHDVRRVRLCARPAEPPCALWQKRRAASAHHLPARLWVARERGTR
jgi:hypothetical protein